MILFIGDSFTYGQGLQYYYLTEHKGWSWEDCEKMVNSQYRFEWLGIDEDEFRKQNSFPYLVSKEIDLPYHTPRCENGSDNQVSYEMIRDIQPFCTTNNITFMVVQFTEPSRSILNGNEPKFDRIDEEIEHQVSRIDELLKQYNVEWLGISWMPEIGKILKDKYPKNFVPIKYNGEYYECFEPQYHPKLQQLTIEYSEGIEDGHFNLEGHKVLSDSILEKYYSRNDLINKVKNLKQKINDTIFG